MPELLQAAHVSEGVICTPLHPLEATAAELAAVLLNLVSGKGGWPWERLQVKLDFVCESTDAYSVDLHHVKLDAEGRCQGQVQIAMNYGYLCQNPRAMLERVVPRMVAEAAAGLATIRTGKKTVMRWEDVFVRLTEHDHRKAVDDEIARMFWSVPIEVAAQGARLGHCRCGSRRRWKAIAPSELARVASGSVLCSACNAPVVFCGDNDAPPDLRDELAFLKRERSRRQPSTPPKGSASSTGKAAATGETGAQAKTLASNKGPAKKAAGKKSAAAKKGSTNERQHKIRL